MPAANTVHVAIELSVSSWLVAARLPGAEKARLHRIEGGDTAALLSVIAELRSSAESMQTRGDWLPVELGFGLTERGWAGAETGVACEAGSGAASRRDDRDRGRAH